MVLYSMEEGVDAPAWVAGSEMIIKLGDSSVTIQSPDRLPHKEVVLSHMHDMFARLPAVEDATRRELGITFGSLEIHSTETAYSGDCSSANFQASLGASSSCCGVLPGGGAGGWAIAKKPNNSGLSVRGLWSYACKNSDTSPCINGGPEFDHKCYFGPCGAHNYNQYQNDLQPNNSSAIVYFGCRQNGSGGCQYPETCYGDSNGSTTGGGYEGTPDGVDPYGGGPGYCNIGYPCTLVLFPANGVGASCPYSNCDANGNPY